ncbi:MAG: AAA family ATPase [Polyangiaceae bacterium]
MITRIEATNYRCFEQLDVDLGRFGVVVGANGSGKTTLLDIPVLLGDLIEAANISMAFLNASQPRGARAGSLLELVHKERGDWFIFAVEAQLPERVVRDLLEGATDTVKQHEDRWPKYVRYELRLQVFNKRALQVQNEYFFTFSEQHQPPRNGARLHGEIDPKREWHFAIRREYGGEAEFRIETKPKAKVRGTFLDPDILALPKVRFETKTEYPAARWLVEALTDEAVFFDPVWSDLRTASKPGLPDRVTADGLNLPWLAMAMRNDLPEHFDAWKEHVRIALPQVTNIEVIEREEDHHAYFRLTYNDSYAVTSSGLSDGTLRVLALTLLPYLASPPKLLVVEEPENGIHPRAIETVLEGLSSIDDSQVLVSSHSPVVVANVKLEDLLAARLRRDGAATVIPGPDHPRLADWKGSIDLGTLFAAGVLG